MSSGAALAAVAKSSKAKEIEKTAGETPEDGEAAEPSTEAVTEETGEATAAPAEGEAEQIDVDSLSGAQLDKLVVEYAIETPDNWKKLKVGEKRAWLKEQFDEAPAGEPAPEVPEIEANGEAEEPAATEPVTEEQWQEAAPGEAETATAVTPATGTAVATTGKAKGSKKPSSKEVQKVLVGEIMVGPDPIQEVVHLVENLQEKDARVLVSQVYNTSDFAAFKLGGLLSVIQTKGWFQPYGSFREYVEGEVGMDYRKATYWTRIYNDLANSNIAWERIKHIPWTKLKEITSILTTENLDEWIEIAVKNTTLQLQEIVRSHKAAAAGKTVEIAGEAKVVTTLTFKVHEDQKATVKSAIQKAKEVVGIDTADTVAMEHIMLDFLNNSPTMPQMLKKLGVEKSLEAFNAAFPEASLTFDPGTDAAAA